MIKYIYFLIFCFYSVNGISQMPISVNGPNGKLKVELVVRSGSPYYQVAYDGKTFMEPSPLGLKTSIGDFSRELSFVSKGVNVLDKKYNMHNAKQSSMHYQANELVVTFVNPQSDTLDIIFRVSDYDIAFSYEIKGAHGQTNLRVEREATGYNLPDDATVFLSSQSTPMIGWMETKPSYEEEYLFDQPVGTPSKYGVGFTYPCLFKVNDKGWLLISETGVDSKYVGSKLGEGSVEGLYPLEFPQEGENNGLGDAFAALAMPARTPWRTITLGETLKPIVESTIAFDVVEPKYEPSIDYKMGRATWSWIVWQDGSINYEDQLEYIDLAAALNFEYVLIDNWWDQRIGYDRMEELVKYAAAKHVSVILWYNSNGWWNNAPQTPQDKMNTAPARIAEMAWMQKIGVKGIKVDFFGGDKQATMQLYEDILTDANQYGIGVTFHGCTLPRGWQRMYPNFVTSEAVLASENLIFTQYASDHHAYNATILPFTRNAVGAMDFAPVFLNQKLSRDQVNGSIRKTTDAFELATGILYFSPVQHFGLTPNNLEEHPDFVLDFIREVPSVWDETLYIGGEPGDYCAIARRKGSNWYVACVNGEMKEKEVELHLPFMRGMEGQMIHDGEGQRSQETKIHVGEDGKVKVKLAPNGGAVIM